MHTDIRQFIVCVAGDLSTVEAYHAKSVEMAIERYINDMKPDSIGEFWVQAQGSGSTSTAKVLRNVREDGFVTYKFSTISTQMDLDCYTQNLEAEVLELRRQVREFEAEIAGGQIDVRVPPKPCIPDLEQQNKNLKHNLDLLAEQNQKLVWRQKFFYSVLDEELKSKIVERMFDVEEA